VKKGMGGWQIDQNGRPPPKQRRKWGSTDKYRGVLTFRLMGGKGREGKNNPKTEGLTDRTANKKEVEAEKGNNLRLSTALGCIS